MKVLRAVFTGLLLALPAVAAAQDVKIDYDKAFDFSTVKTYSMKLGTGWGNDLSERRVLAEFDEAIAARGWKHNATRTSSARPNRGSRSSATCTGG